MYGNCSGCGMVIAVCSGSNILIRDFWKGETIMTTSPVSGSSQIQADYMKLLVTQLQNQNPLEPMNNDQMANQLTQFSQLEQLESMKSSFAKILEVTEDSYANSLLGKEISFVGETESGAADIINATVEQVYKDIDGQFVLSAGDYTLGVESVLSVRN